MKKTIIEEFNAAGILIKRTTITEDEPVLPTPVNPIRFDPLDKMPFLSPEPTCKVTTRRMPHQISNVQGVTDVLL